MPRRYESWVVLEWCNCGSLGSFLRRRPPAAASPGGCEESLMRLLHLLCDAAQGLQELHRQQVVHGDLVSKQACRLLLLCMRQGQHEGG